MGIKLLEKGDRIKVSYTDSGKEIQVEGTIEKNDPDYQVLFIAVGKSERFISTIKYDQIANWEVIVGH